MRLNIILSVAIIILFSGCASTDNKIKGTDIEASEILGNLEYQAFSYGGYREANREIVPTVDQLKDDMKILSAMGVKLIRTYNTQQFEHAENLLKAIKELKNEDSEFEMYVMLGTWIECQGAWTGAADHNKGNESNNTAEIEAAVRMANTYPDIVKIIAVGNEAMVQWAVNYFVYPNVILKWVNYLKELRGSGKIPDTIWITSSDNYESWGGGAKSYQTKDLEALIEAVDFISLHTYPFHDSHYNPVFWGVPEDEESLPELKKIEAAMIRAKNYAISQYQAAKAYMNSIGIEKPIHIGETGWSTIASSSYGISGSRAADEYKEKLYYDYIREWTNTEGISCFYFEAFDEQWKDKGNTLGSENHFGLINLKGEAKYPLWDLVDNDVFDGLTRNGLPITKSYNGDFDNLMQDVVSPPLKREMGLLEISTINSLREVGQPVSEKNYVLVHEKYNPDKSDEFTYPSKKIKLNAWEGTCGIEMTHEGIIEIKTGTGAWWGCSLEIAGSRGENLSEFKSGKLNFDIKGTTMSSFNIGFQTGSFSKGTLVNNQVKFDSGNEYFLTDEWKSYSINISKLNMGADMTDVTAPLFLIGEGKFDGKEIQLKNIYFSHK